MTSHAEAHSSVVAHTDHGHSNGDDSRAQVAAALKIEKSELHDFDMADRAAGQMMGKLLAFLFCVLLFLMTGVNLWMGTQTNTNFLDKNNHVKNFDPQEFGNTDVAAAAGHH